MTPVIRSEAHTLLAFGALLLVAAGIGSIAVAHHHAAYGLDDRILSILPHDYHNRLLEVAADLGAVPAVGVGIITAATLAFRRDPARAVPCLLGPTLTMVVVEFVLKPAVGRRLGTGLSFPSGHVTGVTVTAAAFVVAAPARWRRAATIVGTAAVAVVGFAVVSLGWHLPTDAIGGAIAGAGGFAFVDGAAQLCIRGHGLGTVGARYGYRGAATGWPVDGSRRRSDGARH